jgi:hypothetical protein
MLRTDRAADVLGRLARAGGGHLRRRVEWDEPAGTRRGIARDVDATGALVVAGEGGWCA